MVEEWKSVEGYENSYAISTMGRVMSLKTGKILKQHLRGGNYLGIGLYENGKQTSYSIHSMIAVAFLSHKRCGHELVVNHKDGNRHNNVLSNLEIMTNRENSIDGYRRKRVTSSYPGVSFDKITSMWRARIYVGKKNKHLGRFKEEYDAHLAYQRHFNSL